MYESGSSETLYNALIILPVYQFALRKLKIGKLLEVFCEVTALGLYAGALGEGRLLSPLNSKHGTLFFV